MNRISGTIRQVALIVLKDVKYIVVSLSILAVIVGALYFHTLHPLYVVAGGTSSAILAKILKLAFRVPRPPSSSKSKKKEERDNRRGWEKHLPRLVTPLVDLTHALMSAEAYAMPSSHSQSTAFFSSYITITLVMTIPASVPPSDPTPSTPAMVTAFAVSVAWLAVAWSRVRLGHHTWGQTAAGWAFGTAHAFAWWVLWREAGSRIDGLLFW
ncbi:hypothetical protein M427DRAFT_29727 [Gonapodya prolifera JEL478]|uniref:Phosphatidic acid phosphatase type 2/haloperoxidase domain-containing protein n=1 Tax=Gonapodya prolifera (strain JEL478) TaxID=1344416 RepID=A0A139ANR3_GONPJ|nr:hypothetical protein M427DRAFT_29727 [Gonapodya prolifera JEL478]|eukprot:KXS18397.1 hypothetical protein M427DRAFT_29727 [Gonapodya prolifera JEL478]